MNWLSGLLVFRRIQRQPLRLTPQKSHGQRAGGNGEGEEREDGACAPAPAAQHGNGQRSLDRKSVV